MGREPSHAGSSSSRLLPFSGAQAAGGKPQGTTEPQTAEARVPECNANDSGPTDLNPSKEKETRLLRLTTILASVTVA